VEPPTQPDAEVPESDASSSVQNRPTTLPTDEDAAVATPPHAMYSIKERYVAGITLRRRVRVSSEWRIQIQSGVAASASGGNERTTEYRMDIGEARFGRIHNATVSVTSDQIRPTNVAIDSPAPQTQRGDLAGARLTCSWTEVSGHRCERADELGQAVGSRTIAPQRLLMAPSHPVRDGETWELTGEEARQFLAVDEGELTVQFTLDQLQATYRDHDCHHVAYSIEGTQPFVVRGAELMGMVTGSGEYFLCRPPSLVLYHRQERSSSVSGTIERGTGATPIERFERITMEEETELAEP
jgi:hypothetical protein